MSAVSIEHHFPLSMGSTNYCTGFIHLKKHGIQEPIDQELELLYFIQLVRQEADSREQGMVGADQHPESDHHQQESQHL